MKDKIFQLLKQAYKSLGLGDNVLQAHADMLAGTGIVTEDNVQTIVESQKSFLESLQKENDRRVTEARAKLQAEQKAKEDAAKKLAEEEAEAKRLEELQKKNEVPEYLKKYFEEQAAKEKQAKEDAAKEREEYKKLVEFITKSNNEQKDAYAKQPEEQNVIIKSLQETIRKQQEEAKAKEEAAAKAKAKAEHDAKILSKAKELGIPQSRIEEGFVIAEDADDDTIGNYLTKVANNYKTQQQPVLGAFPLQRAGEPTKEDVDNVAENLVKNL
jgi:chemotaxis protein histidine kinase CheA